MRIVFGICCWISETSQLPELERCLESVKDYRVVLVDGKWYDVESDIQSSIPEAVELIRQYPNVEHVLAINRHEWENRNLYLERCQDDDVLIVIDTDEWIEGHMITVPDNEGFCIMGESERHGGKTVLHRGIRYPSETRHRDRHNEYWRNGHKIAFKGLFRENLAIFEDRAYRSETITAKMKKRGKLRPYR